MLVFQTVGNGHESGRHKRVDDGQEENQRGHDIEWLGLGALNQPPRNTLDSGIIVAL